MSCIHIQGGYRLDGEVYVQGSKNATLPIMAAALLNRGITKLYRCPRIADVLLMENIMKKMGAKTTWENSALIIDASHLQSTVLSGAEAGGMRSSILFLGSMSGRGLEIKMPYPGGCTIGARPINWHIDNLKKMGVSFTIEEETIFCRTSKVTATEIKLIFPSVGVTENVIMAAVLAEGITVLKGAAMEPEIMDLCNFLNNAGARISGIGTDTIRIDGVRYLHDSEYIVMSDRIVAGTYMTAAAVTGGQVTVHGISFRTVRSVADILAESGCGLIIYGESIKIIAPTMLLPVTHIEAGPYPAFPTDMQSQMMVCMCCAYGSSRITESIFENRFKIVPELIRMGAHIEITDNNAVVEGGYRLHGCSVMASDLRGGAALVLAGLAAEGHTDVYGSCYIERGYEHICEDIRALGGMVQMGSG